MPDRYQTGAISLVAADLEQMAAIAEAHRNPLQRWWVLIYRGLLAVFAGQAARQRNWRTRQQRWGTGLANQRQTPTGSGNSAGSTGPQEGSRN